MKVDAVRPQLDKYNKSLSASLNEISFSKISQQLNCSMISQPYKRAKAGVCEAVLPGMVELMALCLLVGLFNGIATVFGVCFVVRNKVDVPVYKA
jgi:preprotein translocase subunit SecY